MDNSNDHGEDQDRLIGHTAAIVSAFAATNHMNEDALISVMRRVYGELKTLGGEVSAAETQQKQNPAVPVKKSVTNDYIICLEDGARVKLLKRYIASRFNMTPAQYRQKWSLPADYPMVAPAYAERRSMMAKERGLGRKPAAAPQPAPAATKGGRKKAGA